VREQRRFEAEWHDYLAALRGGDEAAAAEHRVELERSFGLRLRGVEGECEKHRAPIDADLSAPTRLRSPDDPKRNEPPDGLESTGGPRTAAQERRGPMAVCPGHRGRQPRRVAELWARCSGAASVLQRRHPELPSHDGPDPHRERDARFLRSRTREPVELRIDDHVPLVVALLPFDHGPDRCPDALAWSNLPRPIGLATI
jgi:hypothetical protein